MKPQHHILLVEDSRTQALQLINVLKGQNWDVSHAECAEKAMECLSRATPDLILIDYYLPGVRGDELCRQMRMRVDTRVVPIVILTGDSAQQVELRGLESGADDFIAKSANQDVLLVRLRALLSKVQKASRPSTPSDDDFRGARLLAVDDSQTYLAFLVQNLGAEAYSVQTANSGSEALERLQREDFDCVLVDLVMPGMDGIGVCRQINLLRQQLGKSLMVLMLTAKEDNQSLACALEAGADDFVGKSSDIIVLNGRIRALLRRKFYEQEHRRRLSTELRAKELEAKHERSQKEAAEARAAMVDGLQRMTESLRRSNEELEQFAYVASHDLQEPLRMVASYVQLLEKRYKDRLDSDASEFIKYAVDGTVRMKRLISDLLMYSRVGTRGKEPSPIDCGQVLKVVVANLGSIIQETSAVVTNDPLPTVMGDDMQLVQLLQNLISNAIKYRAESTPEIHIAVEKKEHHWLFSVRDNGIGIDPQYADRIFVIFQRLHSKEKYPGTGIGLAICKKIVERHRGRIWVEPRPEKGSTFYFTLPLAEEMPCNESDVSDRDFVGGGRTR